MIENNFFRKMKKGIPPFDFCMSIIVRTFVHFKLWVIEINQNIFPWEFWQGRQLKNRHVLMRVLKDWMNFSSFFKPEVYRRSLIGLSTGKYVEHAPNKQNILWEYFIRLFNVLFKLICVAYWLEKRRVR